MTPTSTSNIEDSDVRLNLSQHDQMSSSDEGIPSLSSSNSKRKRRLLKRDLPFCQSSNKLAIRNKKVVRMGIPDLVRRDWFHVFLRWPTIKSVAFLVILWTSLIIIFSGLYIMADKIQPDTDCGLTTSAEDIIPFSSAFAFSLETTTTVGYGLPGNSNAFFEGCPELQVVIYFQMLLSLLFNAFLFAFFFARLARSETRGIQVVFGDKAVVKRARDGKFTFNVRVYDVDSQRPLVEAHVRLYAIKKDVHNQDMSFELMRVSNPNDDLGAVLYTSLPSVVSHTIDSHSPIRPKPSSATANLDAAYILNSCGIDLRDDDATTGNRDAYQCVVCGETYGTIEGLTRHIAYSSMLEKNDNVGKGPCKRHCDVDIKALNMWRVAKKGITTGTTSGMLYDEFESLFESEEVEVLAVLEAIDPLMSGTFQAIQSYTLDDIVFGGDFMPCLVRNYHGKNNVAAVDLSKFHQTIMEHEE